LSSSADQALTAAVFGCAGPTLGADEARWFARVQPVGFILFGRNVESPDQVRRLVARLREAVGRHSPVLIDEEGGRVQRLRPPHWPDLPSAAEAARQGEEGARSLGRAISAKLVPLGIDVACAPVLDVPVAGSHDVIGGRAFARDAPTVARLGRACAQALIAAGVAPIAKHIPGHGRATVDSHHALPRVAASWDELRQTDFLPFRELNGLPWAMTAHVVYEAIDADRCATLSPTVIERAIRGDIGFDGVLLTDDLSMSALTGTLAERTAAALAAGCDVVLHCDGKPEAMAAVAQAAGRPTDRAARRLEAASRRAAGA